MDHFKKEIFQEAERLFDAGEFQEYIDLTAGFLRDSNDETTRPIFLLGRAEAFIKLGDYENAQKDYDTLKEERLISDQRYNLGTGRILYHLKKFDDAKRCLLNAISSEEVETDILDDVNDYLKLIERQLSPTHPE